MDTNTYAITLFILTVFMLLYGGISQYDKIEFNTKSIANINHIKIFKGYLIKHNKMIKNNITDVTSDLKLADTFLPNIIKIFMITIEPKKIISLPSLTNETTQSCYMITYNYTSNNNFIELLISNNNEIGDFYSLKKQISLTNIYPFYNNSSSPINILVVVMKRPFWNYYF